MRRLRTVAGALPATAVKLVLVGLLAVLAVAIAGCSGRESVAAGEGVAPGDSTEPPGAGSEPTTSTESAAIESVQPPSIDDATADSSPESPESTQSPTESTQSPTESTQDVTESTDGSGVLDAVAVAGSVLGVAEDEAEAITTANGYEWRVVARDDTVYDLGQDFNPDRLNATVVGGLVMEAYVG